MNNNWLVRPVCAPAEVESPAEWLHARDHERDELFQLAGVRLDFAQYRKYGATHWSVQTNNRILLIEKRERVWRPSLQQGFQRIL